MRKAFPILTLLLAAALLLGAGCQGTNDRFGGPRPRSQPAAGELEELPHEEARKSRSVIDGGGGVVSYRNATLTIPVGAVTAPTFVELAVPAEPPRDVLPDTAVQLSPQGVELRRDALLAIHYNQSDVPPDRDEREIVLVQQVSGVWIEVPNARQQVHIDLIEAPVRYLGLYALQLRPFDQREFNAPPLARFEVSPTPFPAMLTATAALTDPEDLAAPAAPPANAAVDGVSVDGVLTPGGDILPPSATGNDATNSAETPAGPRTGRQTRSIDERRWVAAPEDELISPGPNQAGNEAEAVVSPSLGTAGAGVAATPGDVAMTQTISVQDDNSTWFFDASGSSDPDGTIVQYAWDFDSDGIFDFTSHLGPYARHRFEHSGDYTVTLKVVDNGRYPRAAYATNVVAVRDPQAAPLPLMANIAAFPPAGPAPLTVNFASTVTGGAPPYNYNWVFTDGSQSDLPTPFTTYPEPSQHTISFTVTDSRGESLAGSLFVNAYEGQAPETAGRMTLQITPGADSGAAPFGAGFQLLPERATEPVRYRITWGDEGNGENETISTSPRISHTYATPGFYVVRVLATDALLRTSSTFATVHVRGSSAPVDFLLGRTDAGGDPVLATTDLHIGVDYRSASPRTVTFAPQGGPPADAVTYRWDFGDGTYSTERSPTKTFARDGVYDIELTADDSTELRRHTIWLPVGADEPAVAIQSPTYIEGAAPLRRQWSAIVSRADQPLRYDWNFGGETRTDASPVFEFREPGEHEVRLTVYDANNQPITAPAVVVRARRHAGDYRQPLAVVEPMSGGDRALVLDYDAASPLPLSSTRVEGSVSSVHIAPDGESVAVISESGLQVKRISNSQVVASFLPSVGTVIAARAIGGGAAYATVESAEGLRTWLVRPGQPAKYITGGAVLDAGDYGEVLVVKRTAALDKAAEALLLRVNVTGGVAGEPRQLGRLLEARLTADGAELYYITPEMRVVQREVATGEEVFVTGGSQRKSSLAVAGDGSAIAFVSRNGSNAVIYGSRMAGGDFELTSVTDMTGFFSNSVELSADGDYLLGHGSRNQVRSLLEAERAGTAIDAENVPATTSTADRIGVLRLDLSAPPDSWRIGTVNPRFIVESRPQFSSAGPF